MAKEDPDNPINLNIKNKKIPTEDAQNTLNLTIKNHKIPEIFITINIVTQ